VERRQGRGTKRTVSRRENIESVQELVLDQESPQDTHRSASDIARETDRDNHSFVFPTRHWKFWFSIPKIRQLITVNFQNFLITFCQHYFLQFCLNQIRFSYFIIKRIYMVAAFSPTPCSSMVDFKLFCELLCLDLSLMLRPPGHVMRSARFVCVHVICEHDCYKSNQPISVKLGNMIGPTSWKNWLSFSGDPVPDTNSGSLFHFPHHCGIRNFRIY